MFSFKTFVQAYVTNITVEGSVSMDSIKIFKVRKMESNLLLLLEQVWQPIVLNGLSWSK